MSFLVCACGFFFFLISRAAEKGWQATNGPAGLKFGHPWPHAMYPFSKSNVSMEHKSLSTTSQSPAVIALALFIYLFYDCIVRLPVGVLLQCTCSHMSASNLWMKTLLPGWQTGDEIISLQWRIPHHHLHLSLQHIVYPLRAKLYWMAPLLMNPPVDNMEDPLGSWLMTNSPQGQLSLTSAHAFTSGKTIFRLAWMTI